MTNKELRALRLKLDVTQAVMAEKLGISRVWYGLYERGDKLISKPVQKLAETMQ